MPQRRLPQSRSLPCSRLGLKTIVEPSKVNSTPRRPKVLAEVKGAVHMEPAIDGRLNPFDAHFLGCHVAGLQTSCDKVYGGGADDMCQANTMTLCQIEKDG